MLKKINAGGVESDDGFSIQFTHPELLEYKQGNKIFEISVGDDLKRQIVYIYASQVNNLNEVEKNKMINNIKEAVKLLNGNFEVI